MKIQSTIRKNLLIFLSIPMLHYAQPTQSANQIIPIDGYAAKVNETIITRSDVRSAMSPILPQLYRRYQGDELEQQLEQAYLNAREQLIDQALIVAAFEARGGQIPTITSKVKLTVSFAIDSTENALASKRRLPPNRLPTTNTSKKHAVTSVPPC